MVEGSRNRMKAEGLRSACPEGTMQELRGSSQGEGEDPGSCREGSPEQMEGPHSLETADSRPLSGAELRGWAVAGQLSAAPRPRPARAGQVHTGARKRGRRPGRGGGRDLIGRGASASRPGEGLLQAKKQRARRQERARLQLQRAACLTLFAEVRQVMVPS